LKLSCRFPGRRPGEVRNAEKALRAPVRDALARPTGDFAAPHSWAMTGRRGSDIIGNRACLLPPVFWQRP
jgi:hypothetical protein